MSYHAIQNYLLSLSNADGGMITEIERNVNEILMSDNTLLLVKCVE